MPSKLRDKQIGSARRWSLIGSGLPERIRSVGFAFLGLTAAAGLALVAIFAQTGFPLLSPAPLPGGSSEPSSVSRAVSLPRGSAAAGIGQAQGAVAVSGFSRGQESPRDAGGDNRRSGVDGSAVPVSGAPADDTPDASGSPASPPPAAAPAPAPVSTTPTTTAEPAPTPAEIPVVSPDTGTKPGRSTAVTPEPDEPEVNPAKPESKPVKTKPSKPSKSKSTKPAKPGKPEAAPAPEPSYVPAPAPVPVEKGNENKERGSENKKGKNK